MSRRPAAATMPHMLGLLLRRRLPRRDGNLPRARHGQLAGGGVLVDRGARADIGAARDAHRRHQRRVGTDEAVVLDHSAVLRRAVVDAGDGAGADDDALAELGVADIGEMVRFRGGAEAARLHLDEIADMHLVGEARPGAQPRVGADAAAPAEFPILWMRRGPPPPLGAAPVAPATT